MQGTGQPRAYCKFIEYQYDRIQPFHSIHSINMGVKTHSTNAKLFAHIIAAQGAHLTWRIFCLA